MTGRKDLLYTYNRSKIEFPEITRNKERVLMLARSNSFFPVLLKNVKDVAGARIAYSMWDGYLNKEFRAFCKDKELTIEYIHTSGHANPEDLETFANALNPKVLIPIHTFCADKYKELFDRVKILEDSELFTV